MRHERWKCLHIPAEVQGRSDSREDQVTRDLEDDIGDLAAGKVVFMTV